MRTLFSVLGVVPACASVVATLLATSACGGRSDLGLDGPEDPYGVGASVIGRHDSGSFDGGEAGVVDGGLLPGDASAGDAVAAVPELADCLASPYEIHVVATDFNGTTGAFGTSGSKAAWRTIALDGYLEIFADPRWDFAMKAASDKSGFVPGTYPSVSASSASYAQIEFAGVSCHGSVPTGTFTIVDYAATGTTPGPYPRVLVWFDLGCDEGRLTGCVRYGE